MAPFDLKSRLAPSNEEEFNVCIPSWIMGRQEDVTISLAQFGQEETANRKQVEGPRDLYPHPDRLAGELSPVPSEEELAAMREEPIRNGELTQAEYDLVMSRRRPASKVQWEQFTLNRRAELLETKKKFDANLRVRVCSNDLGSGPLTDLNGMMPPPVKKFHMRGGGYGPAVKKLKSSNMYPQGSKKRILERSTKKKPPPPICIVPRRYGTKKSATQSGKSSSTPRKYWLRSSPAPPQSDSTYVFSAASKTVASLTATPRETRRKAAVDKVTRAKKRAASKNKRQAAGETAFKPGPATSPNDADDEVSPMITEPKKKRASKESDALCQKKYEGSNQSAGALNVRQYKVSKRAARERVRERERTTLRIRPPTWNQSFDALDFSVGGRRVEFLSPSPVTVR
ncbi:hypothetical protein P152DRAFT_460582 [Eremomyces bilateralis CBS 781.70]|uniref:Uncharacterized protein n=1 Tax=Eremomyces bilateralis CBS 781.70 TaxID=1392243 RepID=A0A6G1FX35_9PEZI|nr:uncharacterized protein P152DRAFT_460582 [Eremomyces bilateralis CBS 781.70]KAF1810455.1 hypothetical protein P152DRAFT_460582 [Eremomyces bilateralis CBS 781.70]